MLSAVRIFREIYRIEEVPASMLAGIELFQHRFSGNPENQCFFEIRKTELFPGSPFSDHFGDLFSENIGCKLPSYM